MWWGKKRGLVTVTVYACTLYGFGPLWASIALRPFIFGKYKLGTRSELFKSYKMTTLTVLANPSGCVCVYHPRFHPRLHQHYHQRYHCRGGGCHHTTCTTDHTLQANMHWSTNMSSTLSIAGVAPAIISRVPQITRCKQTCIEVLTFHPHFPLQGWRLPLYRVYHRSHAVPSVLFMSQLWLVEHFWLWIKDQWMQANMHWSTNMSSTLSIAGVAAATVSRVPQITRCKQTCLEVLTCLPRSPLQGWPLPQYRVRQSRQPRQRRKAARAVRRHQTRSREAWRSPPRPLTRWSCRMLQISRVRSNLKVSDLKTDALGRGQYIVSRHAAGGLEVTSSTSNQVKL